MSLSNNKKKGCGCLPLISIFFLIGLGGSYFFSRYFLGEELTPSQGAKIIPQQAVMTSFITTSTQEWSKLTEFGTPQTREVINKSWQNFSQELTKDNHNLDYQKDIEPWLGGIMLTILPSPQVGFNYDLVMIAGIKNKFKAENFRRKLAKQANFQTQSTKYQNITIYQYQDHQNNIFWLTQFQNYLVVANQEESIKKIIDTFKNKNSLASQQKFSNALTQKVKLKNPVIQIYLADYDRLIENTIKNSIGGTNSPPQLTEINSIVMAIGIENNGIQGQAFVDLKNSLTLEQLKPLSNDLIKQFPPDTFLMINGRGINQAWQEIESQRRLIPKLNDLITYSQDFANQWLNLNLETDIFSWMDGEFALGLFSLDDQYFYQNKLGGLLLLETKNRPQAEKLIGTIETFSQSFALAKIHRKNIQNLAVTEWKILPSFLFSYGWFGNDSLMVTIGTDFPTVNNLKNNSSLLNSKNFEITTQSLPQNNLGYFYFDFHKALNFNNNKIANQLNISPEITAITDSIKAIAMTTSNINEQTTQLDLFISLKKE